VNNPKPTTFKRVAFVVGYIVPEGKEDDAVDMIYQDLINATTAEERPSYITIEDAPNATWDDVPSFITEENDEEK
jgi:hypothetical protein